MISEGRPLLSRVYAGEEQYPLPWMRGASRHSGSTEPAKEYWRKHAYIYGPRRVSGPFASVPDWFAPPV